MGQNATMNSASFATTMSCDTTAPTFILDKSERAKEAGLAAKKSINADARAEENQKKTSLLLDSLDISSVKASGTFLDGCKVFLSGYTERQIGQIRRVLKFAGATWLSALAESVTHVVHGFGCNVDHVDPATVKAVQELDISPHNVSLEWLVASMKEGKPAMEADHVFPPEKEVEGRRGRCEEIIDERKDEENSSQFEDSLMAQYGSTSMRVM